MYEMGKYKSLLEFPVCLVFFSALLLSLVFAKDVPQQSFNLNIWPKPRSISWPDRQVTSLLFSFHIYSPKHKYLCRAVSRYNRLILTEQHTPYLLPSFNVSSAAPLSSLSISVSNLSAPLQHGVDESYSLGIPASGGKAQLIARTTWGAMRGLETFSQLVVGRNKLWIPVGLRINDAPLFPHRGVLLDTSRNYYELEHLLRLIRTMSANKLNVFHWHITDSHSFPLALPKQPELAEKGSYGSDMQYTPSNVSRVVEYGMSHGVRVMPEFDAPGHTGSWAEAYPEIVTCAGMFWWSPGTEWRDRLASEPGTGQLNPLKNKTYEVFRNIIDDASSLFSEPFFHAGGDEIATGCWKTDPGIAKFVADGGTLSQLLEVFINATRDYIVSKNRTVVYWEDVLLDPTVHVNPGALPRESTILQTWNNGPINTKRIVEAGYRAIVSSADFYYLDCGHGSFLGNDSRYDRQVKDPPGQPFNYEGGNGGSWCGPYKTWQRVYDYDITYGLNEAEAKLVLGGEVALWSEQADPTVMDSRIWPRASAMAEVLWSGNRDDAGVKRYAEALHRLNDWRLRMVGRGVGAEPLQPLWCASHPGMCNRVQ